jgi:hypothetical protein
MSLYFLVQDLVQVEVEVEVEIAQYGERSEMRESRWTEDVSLKEVSAV